MAYVGGNGISGNGWRLPRTHSPWQVHELALSPKKPGWIPEPSSGQCSNLSQCILLLCFTEQSWSLLLLHACRKAVLISTYSEDHRLPRGSLQKQEWTPQARSHVWALPSARQSTPGPGSAPFLTTCALTPTSDT